jgi:hypothetical protein
MANWREMKAAAPELATAAQAVFDAHKHKTMATLRADGAPRISGIEMTFVGDDVWLGMMHGSVKARDLQRDPRVALHSATVDIEMKQGDAKLSGRAVGVTDTDAIRAWLRDSGQDDAGHKPGSMHLFRIDVTEVVLTRVGEPADHLLIELWREGTGVRRIERR